MADIIYDSFLGDVAKGNIDLDTDTIKCLLVTSSYTPDRAHDKRDDITNEVTGTGYTTGGAEVGSKAVTVDGVNHLAKFDGADVTWADSTITARGAVLYKARGGASSADELIGYWDFGSDKSSSAGPFTVQWNTSGILTYAQA